jgi:hypothetical protein
LAVAGGGVDLLEPLRAQVPRHGPGLVRRQAAPAPAPTIARVRGVGHLPPSSWERRHPGAESWSFDFFTADGSLGGFVGLTFHAEPGVCWYWAGLVGTGRPYLLVRDQEVELPRQPGSREVRSEALWADMNCETPFDHWSFALEAFGVALEDPAEALAGERGDRTGLGLDLEWEAVAGVAGAEGRYDQPGVVHGEVLVGGGAHVEAIDFDGYGWRRHAWGQLGGLVTPRSWLGGRLDDGSPHRRDDLAEDLRLEPLHRAPLLLEASGRRAALDRRLCRFVDPRAGAGLGWAEWLRPEAAP